jgi:site-specific DNA-methyltransferase (adenine-specific)/site-specific DNA-methyltransferase (cytosine-N4-specific)
MDLFTDIYLGDSKEILAEIPNNMFQERVMEPVGEWSKTRLKNLSATDKRRDNSKVATECNNKKHSAAFPDGLPAWFIKLFTSEGDTVLDPFMGSGTTVIVARRMGRSSIGIDIVPEFVKMVKTKIELYKNTLFEKRDIYDSIKLE